jgi:excisionase family DNA binding protein
LILREVAVHTKLYTITEIAEFFRIDESIVKQLVGDGALGAYTVGNEYRFSDAHITAYLAAHEVGKAHQPITVMGGMNSQEQESTTMIGKPGIPEGWREDLRFFLNEHEIIIKMREASDGGRPAAEGIATDLVTRFGNDIKQDNLKKLIGRLIKPVMEEQGYRHYKRGVRCRPNPVFSVASSYQRI